MRNPIQTRQKILDVAGALFNCYGYKATSIGDITKAAGLTKGAIYKHFENKEALEAQACAASISKITEAITIGIRSANNVQDKLSVIYSFYADFLDNPILVGGCPLLNGAIEADDSGDHLKPVVKTGLLQLRDAVAHILHKGIKYQQLSADTPVAEMANIVIASIEGALMMSKILNDMSYYENVVTHLKSILTPYYL